MPSWLQHSYQQQEKIPEKGKGVLIVFQSKQPTEPPQTEQTEALKAEYLSIYKKSKLCMIKDAINESNGQNQ